MNRKRFVSHYRPGPQGFTLIELLVVIGIIAILAAVVVTAVNPGRQFALARDTQRTANVATILNAVDENMSEHQGIFTCSDGARALPDAADMMQSGDALGGDIAGCLVPNYISAMPFDPSYPGSHYASTSSYLTAYSIWKDAAGHVTVSAHSEIHPDSDIAVTR